MPYLVGEGGSASPGASRYSRGNAKKPAEWQAQWIAEAREVEATTRKLDGEYLARDHAQAEAGEYDERDGWNEVDSDGDPCFGHRIQRMSFNGQSDPPMPPDGRTIPTPSNDWFTETVEFAPVQPAARVASASASIQSTYPGYETQQRQSPFGYTYPTSQYPAPVGQAYQNYLESAPAAWSVNGVYSGMGTPGYRAPVLPPRDIQFTSRSSTSLDTYRYYAPRVEPAYPVSPSVKPTTDAINIAYSRWYADQVIDLLVKPGQFRPGVRGSSDAVWGPMGRIKDEVDRTGRPSLHYPKPGGRMGMPDTPPLSQRKGPQRFPEYETRDPWNVLWCNQPETSPSLVAYVHEMMTRMTIAPSSVIAAVWYLTGLGLHRGDGEKGSRLREFFVEHAWMDLESVEKRVATLGFLLAGKWLDDNSFLSKSW
jgi:hypothetical protein